MQDTVSERKPACFNPCRSLFSSPVFCLPSFCFLISFVLLFSFRAFAEPAAGLPEVKTYDQLITAIRAARQASSVRLERAAEQEKVREAWETGKFINEHILQHTSPEKISKSSRAVVDASAATKERADYGKQVILRLSKDLGTSDTELYYMLQFARTYPNFRSTGNLPWGHYQALLSINDEKERSELAEKATKENWTQDQIRAEVRKRKIEKGEAEEKPKPALAPAQPGKLHTYRVVPGVERGEAVIDLGFSNYYKPEKKFKFKEGDILQFVKGKPKKLQGALKEDLYTYEVKILQVIDGDTLRAVVDLGFGFNTVQTLRLRGLDAPEIISAEGKESKAFFEKELKKGPVVIRSVKSDKYDRYLADIFVNGEYVNQKLVEEGLAVTVTRGLAPTVNQGEHHE